MIKYTYILCMLVSATFGMFAANTRVQVSVNQFLCLAQLNYTYFIMEAATPYGTFNDNITISLN